MPTVSGWNVQTEICLYAFGKKKIYEWLTWYGRHFLFKPGHILWNLENANYAYCFEIFK